MTTTSNGQPAVQTTDAGIPVESDTYSLTVGAGGPILLQDSYLIEQMANFNRGNWIGLYVTAAVA